MSEVRVGSMMLFVGLVELVQSFLLEIFFICSCFLGTCDSIIQQTLVSAQHVQQALYSVRNSGMQPV